MTTGLGGGGSGGTAWGAGGASGSSGRGSMGGGGGGGGGSSSDGHRKEIVVLIPSDGKDGETIHKLTLRGTDFVIKGDELDIMDGPRVIGRFEEYVGAFFAEAMAPEGSDLG